MRITIIGSGMAGLVAAHAVIEWMPERSGIELVIYGPTQKQIQGGARYYEREIPNLAANHTLCSTEANGRPEDYPGKVGGPISAYTRVRPSFIAYDFRHAYELLYEQYSWAIIDMPMGKNSIESFHWGDCDYVFNTSPRPNFYDQEEMKMFAATRHWRLDEVIDEIKTPYTLPQNNINKNMMIFDSSEDSSFFRLSQLFGLMTVEWGFPNRPPISDVHLEILPLGVPKELGLRHVVPGWRDTKAMAHVGDLARWEPSTDIAEVFFQVQDVLNWKGIDDDNDGGRRD